MVAKARVQKIYLNLDQRPVLAEDCLPLRLNESLLSRKLTLELSESAARNAPKLAPMFSIAVGVVDSLFEK